MCLIAEVEIETPLLAEARAVVPELSLHFQQETLAKDGPARFFFWAQGGDFEAFETAIDADPTVDDVAVVGTVADRRMYRVDIAEAIEGKLTYPDIVENDIVFLGSRTTDEGWRLRLQCPDRVALSAYRAACRDRDIPFRLQSLFDDREERQSDLTPVQREVLEVALEEGYFNIPRDATTGDLGARLGISAQSVSERLRRALSKAAASAVRDAPPAGTRPAEVALDD